MALLIGALLLAAYQPGLARRLPGAPAALAAAADLLPRRVAWANDPGTARLRSGVYFGWTDGERGELHLYGEGCASEHGGGAPIYLALRGPAGTVEVPPGRVTQLWAEFDRGRSHPYLHLELAASETLEFDAAHLRCRSGAEASARIAATLLHLPAATQGLPPAAGQAELHPPAARQPEAPHPFVGIGTASFPGSGLVSEITLATGPALAPVVLTAIDYAPANAATSHLRAAAGSPAQSALWRSQVRALGARPKHLLDPASLTPWDAAYQSPADPRSLGRRRAGALDLTLGPNEVAMLFLGGASFRRTLRPLPILVQPLLRYEVRGEEPAALLVGGPAFGWTDTP